MKVFVMPLFKSAVRQSLSLLGYEIRRSQNLPGKHSVLASMAGARDPFEDMCQWVTATRPVVFDVGANVGQTIAAIRQRFKESAIHSFEPSLSTFQTLQKTSQGLPDLYLNNVGMGAFPGTKTFVENTRSEMSSFLEPGEECWGSVTKRTQIRIDTVDEYCARSGVEHIDILKCDAQGFELEVLRGAKGVFDRKRIGLVYLEVLFSAMYENQSGIDELFKFLFDYGFRVISFYDMHYQDGLLGWTDVLLVDPRFFIH
jgi:FkbM family methyltransferase